MTACHVLNRVPTKNKTITPFDEWERKRLKLSYLQTWGFLAKVIKCANTQEAQAWTKNRRLCSSGICISQHWLQIFDSEI